MKKITFLLVSVLFFNCSKTNKIKVGTFHLYESDTLIGTIYRLDNFQFEKYPNGKTLVAKIDYLSDSTYTLKGIETSPTKIEEISFLNHYKEIEKNKFEIIAKPENIKSDYVYKAVLVKISETINSEYIDTLNVLNKNK